MNIIGKKYIFLVFSGILIITSVAAIGIWGLKLGIDFTGGSLLEVSFASSVPNTDDIQNALQTLQLDTIVVQPVGDHGVIIRMKHIDEETHQKILVALAALTSEKDVTELRFDTIGPTIGRELRNRSMSAIVLASVMIVVYIGWAFRHVSEPVSSWKYGVVAVLALVHDVTIPPGVFAFLGRFYGIEIDALFITALLTVMGFSVHDTIVVFDRIRENLRKIKKAEPYAETVNRSINETIVRSINTSCTVLLVLGAIFFLGGETTRHFSLVLILGIIFGTYSSIFVASPLLVVWNQLRSKKKH